VCVVCVNEMNELSLDKKKRELTDGSFPPETEHGEHYYKRKTKTTKYDVGYVSDGSIIS